MTLRLLLMQPYSLPPGAAFAMQRFDPEAPKEARLANYADLAPLLADVAWDVHPGAMAPHGEGGVETAEEFLLVAASRLPLVRAACASGQYDAVVLLGGGDPGFQESREIGRRHGIPVTTCGHAQMHIATMLGRRFGVLDVSETHAAHTARLVAQYGFADRCASIRTLDFPLPRPGFPDDRPIAEEQARAAQGASSAMLEAACREAVAAIEADGAEVVTLGCGAAFWLRPYLQRRLLQEGWEVPVLEGFGAAIQQAKLLAGLGLAVSGLAFPVDRPARVRRRRHV